MDISTIVGNGKTFSGALILILTGILSWLGWMPDAVHLSVSPTEAISGGLVAIGLGAKLQALINLLNAQKA